MVLLPPYADFYSPGHFDWLEPIDPPEIDESSQLKVHDVHAMDSDGEVLPRVGDASESGGETVATGPGICDLQVVNDAALLTAMASADLIPAAPLTVVTVPVPVPVPVDRCIPVPVPLTVERIIEHHVERGRWKRRLKGWSRRHPRRQSNNF